MADILPLPTKPYQCDMTSLCNRFNRFWNDSRVRWEDHTANHGPDCGCGAEVAMSLVEDMKLLICLAWADLQVAAENENEPPATSILAYERWRMKAQPAYDAQVKALSHFKREP